jgi:EpsI family protein
MVAHPVGGKMVTRTMMRRPHAGWIPAGILIGGLILTGAGTEQRSIPLRRSLDDTVPRVINDQVGQDVTISEEERRVAGMSNYVMRTYAPGEGSGGAPFSVYVGYYENQTQGRTIHSPKNCLPGAGWEALTSREEIVETPAGAVTVNHYVLQNGAERAIAIYWYQGRGRVTANEYVVKWNLLRDQMLRRRSDEALVRILVPVAAGDTDQLAFEKAARLVGTVMPAVGEALPL